MKHIHRLVVALLLFAAGMVVGIHLALEGLDIGLPSDLAFSLTGDKVNLPAEYTVVNFQSSAWYVDLPPMVYWIAILFLLGVAAYICFAGWLSEPSGNKQQAAN